MLENEYQSRLIRRIKHMLPGSMILKNDSGYLQGIPDLTVFYKSRWATLEVKVSANTKHQPNQDYYVERMNKMSYSSFIYPEIEDEILDELIIFLTK